MESNTGPASSDRVRIVRSNTKLIEGVLQEVLEEAQNERAARETALSAALKRTLKTDEAVVPPLPDIPNESLPTPNVSDTVAVMETPEKPAPIALDKDEIRTFKKPPESAWGKFKGLVGRGIETAREEFKHTTLGRFAASVERAGVRFLDRRFIDKAEGKFAKANERATKTEGRFTRHDAAVKGLGAEIQKLDETVKNFEARGLLDEKVRAKAARERASLEGRVEKETRKREAARVALQAHNTSKLRWENAIKDRARGATSRVENRVAPHRERAAELSAQCEQFRDEIKAHGEVRDSVAQELAKIERELENARFSFERSPLKKEITAIRAELKRADEAIMTRTAELGKFEGRLGKTTGQVEKWSMLTGDLERAASKERSYHIAPKAPTVTPSYEHRAIDTTSTPAGAEHIPTPAPESGETIKDVTPEEYVTIWNALYGSDEPIDLRIFDKIKGASFQFQAVEKMIANELLNRAPLEARTNKGAELVERAKAVRRLIASL